MNNNLGFSPSPLEAFEKTGQPFIVYKGRLYTVEKPVEHETRNKLHLGATSHNVFPADTLIDIRNEQFSRNEERLKNYMNWVVTFKVVRRINELAEKLEKNIDYYGRIRQDKVRTFMLDVFDNFNHARNKPLQNINITTRNPETAFDIRELDALPDLFDDCFPQPGMVAIGDWAYKLTALPNDGTFALPGLSNYNPGANRLELARQHFLLESYMPLRDVIIDYDAKTRGLIEKTAMRQGRHYVNQLTQIKDQQSSLASLVQRHHQAITDKRQGDISYRQLQKDTYRITIDIQPFLFEREGKYYAFSTQRQNGSKHVQLSMDVIIDDLGVTLDKEPFVQNKPYFHPFIFESGSICYNGNIGNPWKEKGIAFAERLPHDTPGLARKVMLILHEGRSSITNGLLGTHAKPVHGFDNFRPVAYTEREAREYARSNGIDQKRIFRN